MYSMWKIMCFLNFEPCKHIALHQIHKIMFFLATSYVFETERIEGEKLVEERGHGNIDRKLTGIHAERRRS